MNLKAMHLVVVLVSCFFVEPRIIKNNLETEIAGFLPRDLEVSPETCAIIGGAIYAVIGKGIAIGTAGLSGVAVGALKSLYGAAVFKQKYIIDETCQKLAVDDLFKNHVSTVLKEIYLRYNGGCAMNHDITYYIDGDMGKRQSEYYNGPVCLFAYLDDILKAFSIFFSNFPTIKSIKGLCIEIEAMEKKKTKPKHYVYEGGTEVDAIFTKEIFMEIVMASEMNKAQALFAGHMSKCTTIFSNYRYGWNKYRDEKKYISGEPYMYSIMENAWINVGKYHFHQMNTVDI